MTRQFHTYLRPATAELRAVALAALEAFASQIGAPQKPTAVGGWRVQVRHWVDEPLRPSLLEDRTYGQVLLRSLEPGDTLITPSIADLADIPSNLDAVLRALVARGIALHVLALPGLQGSQIQPLVHALADAFLPLETARKRLEEELAAVQARAEQRLDQALQAGMQTLARNWGLPSALKIGMPSLGNVAEPVSNGRGHLGEAVAKERKARGMSQAQLAKSLGLSQTTISRLESDGTGESMPAVLDHLFAPDTEGASHASPA